VDLGADAADGGTVEVTAKGDLTIHGKTRSVEMPLKAKLVDGTVAVVGSTDIKFSDFDVEVPHSPVVLSVEDHGVVELQLLLKR
ncbi:MAG: YceI family protein, partial [Microthrixaceae bacterium]